MQPVERRILVKVANMYYVENLKQSEIAQRMGIDRTTVSKYLKKALKDKIVKITVESDSFDELEAALEHRFGLKEACVVPKSYDMQVIKQNMANGRIMSADEENYMHFLVLQHLNMLMESLGAEQYEKSTDELIELMSSYRNKGGNL